VSGHLYLDDTGNAPVLAEMTAFPGQHPLRPCRRVIARYAAPICAPARAGGAKEHDMAKGMSRGNKEPKKPKKPKAPPAAPASFSKGVSAVDIGKKKP